MPSIKRHKTGYPGVTYIIGTSRAGKPERIYYIRYRKNGRLIEEKAGRQFQNDMTPARASALRIRKIEGDALTNAEKRDELRDKTWTYDNLMTEYESAMTHFKRPDDKRYTYDKHLKSVIGSLRPEDITPRHIDAIKKTIAAGYKPRTVESALQVIRRLATFGTERNLCKPISFKIEMPKYDNIKTEDITAEQIDNLAKILAVKKNIEISALIHIALYTALRKSEMLKLRWKDIDFARGFITIEDGKGVITGSVPMPETVRKILVGLPSYKNSPLLFPSPKTGGVRDRGAFSRQLRKIRDDAGLPSDFRPLHGLRHSFASELASSGEVDLNTIRHLLRHRDPRTTDRYTHLRDEALRRASELNEKLRQKKLKSQKDDSTKPNK